MPSREELCKTVKNYLEGIAKMKERPKAERDANRLLKTIRARVKPRKYLLRVQSVIILTCIRHAVKRMDQNQL